jgi:hypothetical protein
MREEEERWNGRLQVALTTRSAICAPKVRVGQNYWKRDALPTRWVKGSRDEKVDVASRASRKSAPLGRRIRM